MTKVRPGSKEGFTIVEILVAVVVLSIGILAVATMAGSAVTQVRRGFNITNSTLAAQQVLDRYLMLPFDSLQTGLSSDTISLAGLDYVVISDIDDVSAQWSPASSNVIYRILVYAGGGLAQNTRGERYETYVYNPDGL